MKLSELLNLITSIVDRYPGAGDAEVEVGKWDDNPYDGMGIVGVRVNSDTECSGCERVTVFILPR